MATSTALNLSNYQTVWDDNFTNGSGPNPSIFAEKWGNADDFSTGSRLTLTSYQSEGWQAAGFLQPDYEGPSGSQGYGLYSATFSMNAHQGTGPAIVMWPANNVWPGPEIDLMEDWSDPTRQTGYATIHWKGAGNTNQYQTYTYHANMTQRTTAAMDWEAGSLTFYINGKVVFRYTGSHVPKDYAHGGINEAFGAEVTSAGSNPVSTQVSLNLYDMSYSKPKSASLLQTAQASLTPTAIGASDTPTFVGTGAGTLADVPAIAPGQANATFTFETVRGAEVINNFLPSDTLDLASSLRASLKETVSGGGLLLTFGSASDSIFLPGVTHLTSSQIKFI